jgi:hypothetical protein
VVPGAANRTRERRIAADVVDVDIAQHVAYMLDMTAREAASRHIKARRRYTSGAMREYSSVTA